MVAHDVLKSVLTPRDLPAYRLMGRHHAKVEVLVETPQYIVRTADTKAELEQIFALRNRIFFLAKGKVNRCMRLEWDDFDVIADHLTLIHKETNQVVGTYRALCSHFTGKFYSSTEFDLGSLLQHPGVLLELGRACVDPVHRNGTTLPLLWRGVVQYFKQVEADLLFGCSSFPLLSQEENQNVIHQMFASDRTADEYGIRPLSAFHPSKYNYDIQPTTPEELVGKGKIEMPPLMALYASAGATFAPVPAVDIEFQCFDYLTVLPKESIRPAFRKRYGL
jgi:putative hemolysin